MSMWVCIGSKQEDAVGAPGLPCFPTPPALKVTRATSTRTISVSNNTVGAGFAARSFTEQVDGSEESKDKERPWKGISGNATRVHGYSVLI